MVTFDDAKEFLTITEREEARETDNACTVLYGGRAFVPMYRAHGRPYHTYFKVST
ncbi:MAG: hypothetical protein II836_04460 [Clostridia bacterium]|nr:hypothetical protein [Clostridia bacterium]